MSRRSCMGGFCHHREACALHMGDDRQDPEERICAPGREEPVPLPIVVAPSWRNVGGRVMREAEEAQG